MASTSQSAHAVVEMQPPVSFLPAPAAALVHWLLTLSIGCLLNSLAHNPWREGTGGADTAWIKHKWCGISFIPWTSCPSSVVHHTYVATESKQFLCTYMDLWWSEAASDGTKMREHSRQSCWSNHFCSPKWITLELEGKQFSTEEGIALASFSLYQAVLHICICAGLWKTCMRRSLLSQLFFLLQEQLFFILQVQLLILRQAPPPLAGNP